MPLAGNESKLPSRWCAWASVISPCCRSSRAVRSGEIRVRPADNSSEPGGTGNPQERDIRPRRRIARRLHAPRAVRRTHSRRRTTANRPGAVSASPRVMPPTRSSLGEIPLRTGEPKLKIDQEWCAYRRLASVILRYAVRTWSHRRW